MILTAVEDASPDRFRAAVSAEMPNQEFTFQGGGDKMHKAVLAGLDLDRWVDLAFSLDDEKEAAAEQMEAEHERPYRALYEALETGKISAFSFRQGANVRIVARSTRPDVLIQASLFWDAGGDFEPVSHADINNFEDLREVIPQSEAEACWIPAA